MAERLKILYQETAVPNLIKQFQYQNVHQVPKPVKVVVNRGLGKPLKMLRPSKPP